MLTPSSQHTPGVESYVYDGVDGSQMAFWSGRRPNSKRHHGEGSRPLAAELRLGAGGVGRDGVAHVLRHARPDLLVGRREARIRDVHPSEFSMHLV